MFLFPNIFAVSSFREKDVILVLDKDNLAFVIFTKKKITLELCIKFGLG